ncbi:uncharacterized protein LOC18441622 isoform X2 [Amborella trichopoda]|uniref:uncharacterized protein LOC18441622 isoform X2 n=1 Tax=Amborella trichopoda TaxID=13333 RepID=UPI0009C02785|nr:uncharacterized protein LOC18441622 isoform X2 [Amborella trichopoda]|eukprot:XP_020527525.1 uncharacterized protein LOC18441622 isoform X2 [Amborella trichopoda]
MQGYYYLLLFGFLGLCTNFSFGEYDGPRYDSTAYTECKLYPEAPLYNGGILAKEVSKHPGTQVYSPAYVLRNLTKGAKYTFSCWVRIKGAGTARVMARLLTDNSTDKCVGTVSAQSGCWSFLKGGFVATESNSVLFLQDSQQRDIEISIASASLQPFTDEQWRMHQEDNIRSKRQRRVAVHISDAMGRRLQGAIVTIEQKSKAFPFGSAIAKTILGNQPYEDWFAERFNAAVFENELKWYATEPEPGKLNYSLPDQLLRLVRSRGIPTIRGHNIFWEDPVYTPSWVRNLSGNALLQAVNSRIQSLMSRYKGEFVHWDVSNEMLHFDFYESRLGPNATAYFFETAKRSDPWATLFMNDFNVVETCGDENSTVDVYVSRLRELMDGGYVMDGIGLEAHFTRPNVPLMRSILDKLATLGLPIWLTEVDISKTLDHETQATYLEEVLREGFSHPSINGIMLWTALHPNGCYQMCLTDNNLHNLPTGVVVDKLLKEWETKEVKGLTGDRGSFDFQAFLGEYKVIATFGAKTVESSLSVCQGDETLHMIIPI